MLNRFGKLFLAAPLTILMVATFSISKTPPTSPDGLLAKLKCHDRVHDIAYSSDGKLIAAGFGWSTQGGAKIWNTADNSLVATLIVGKGDDANVERVSFSNDGKLFAIANWHGDVILWVVGSWRNYKIILTNQDSPKALSFSPDSTKLVLTAEHTVVIYNLKTEKSTIIAKKNGNADSFISASFSSDGKSLIVCDNDSVHTLDIATGKSLSTWKTRGSGFFGTITPDGKFVIAGGGAIYGEKSVEIRSTENGKKISELSEFRSGLFALAVSHSGSRFAVSGGDYGNGGDLSIWNLTEAKEIGYTSFGEFPIQRLAYSPNDKVLAAASEDGFVLLYEADRIVGPHVKKQDYSLCGEILREADKIFIVPISKVPSPMRQGLEYNWKLEIVNREKIIDTNGTPVALEDWDIESNAANDRVRIRKIYSLGKTESSSSRQSDHIVFGDIQNPGWNEGSLTKIYSDGAFVVTNNPGKCVAYGSLEQLNTDFASIKHRLVSEGIIAIPKIPLTPSTAHFRSRFVEIASNGITEVRSDAEDFKALREGGPAKKREAFDLIFTKEEPFLNSLLVAGKKNLLSR